MTDAQRFAAVVDELPSRAQAPLRRAWALASEFQRAAMALAVERLAIQRRFGPDLVRQGGPLWVGEVAQYKRSFAERYGGEVTPGVPRMTRMQAAALALSLYQTGLRLYSAGELAKEWNNGGLTARGDEAPDVNWLTPAASLFGWFKSGDRFHSLDGSDEEWGNAPAEPATLMLLWTAWERFAKRKTVYILRDDTPYIERFEPNITVWQRLARVVWDTLKRRYPEIMPYPPRLDLSPSVPAWLWLVLLAGGVYVVAK